MLRKGLIVASGFVGALLIGTVGNSAPASAHYACGPWNGWCASKYWSYPGYRHGWYGHRYKQWGNSHHRWNKGKHHSNKGNNWRRYR